MVKPKSDKNESYKTNSEKDQPQRLKIFEGVDIETDTAPALLRKLIEENPQFINSISELTQTDIKIFGINLQFAKRYHIPELIEFVYTEMMMRISLKRKGRKELIDGIKLAPQYQRFTAPINQNENVRIEP